jgi:hypothetical protein
MYTVSGEGKTNAVDGHFPFFKQHNEHQMHILNIDLTTQENICIAANNDPIAGTQARVLSFTYDEEKSLKSGVLKGISTFHNFEFDFVNKGIRAWVAWGVGEGEWFPEEKLLKYKN